MVSMEHKFNFWGIGGALILAACGAMFADLTWPRVFFASFLFLLGVSSLLRAARPHWFLIPGREEKRFSSSNLLEVVQVAPRTRWQTWGLAISAIVTLSATAGFAHYREFGGHMTHPLVALSPPTINHPASSPQDSKPTDLIPSGRSGAQTNPFPKAPLEVLDFLAFKGGVIKNNSDETLLVVAFTTSARLGGREDSLTFGVDSEIKPHAQFVFSSGIAGTWSTLYPYSSADWDIESQAVTHYGQCARPLPFLPDSPAFRQVVDHYHAMNQVLPVGDAKGTIFYRRLSDAKERTQGIPLKSLIFLQEGCTPQPFGRDGS